MPISANFQVVADLASTRTKTLAQLVTSTRMSFSQVDCHHLLILHLHSFFIAEEHKMPFARVLFLHSPPCSHLTIHSCLFAPVTVSPFPPQG